MSGGGGGKGGGKGGGGSQVIGYRYFFGIHMGIGRGPVDELCEIKVGDRTAWSGSVTSNTKFDISQPNLFGGEKKEGGIIGKLDVLMGGSTQVLPPDDSYDVDTSGFIGSLVSSGLTSYRSLRRLFGANVPSAVTVTGTAGGNGLYARTTANDGSIYYSAVIGGSLWTIRRDGFKRWVISNGTTTYRSFSLLGVEAETPEQVVAWRTVGITQGGFNFEINDYDKIEVTSPVVGITVTANYSLVPHFRRMFTVYFDGIISMNNPYPKPWKFRVRRVLQGWDGDVWQPGLAAIQLGDIRAMNPAHIIYECLTNREWGRGMSRDLIDEDAFLDVATTLYGEGFGLCLRWSRTDTIQNFVQSVLNHIGGVMFTSRTTGKMTLRLIRGDYDINTLPTFTHDTGLLDVGDSAVASVSLGVNEVKVTYRDPKTDEDLVVRVSNLAAIQAAGGAVNTSSREYKGLPTAELATRVAQRDLRANSVSLRKFTVTLDRRGRVVEPGAVFVISDPSRAIPATVVRAATVEDGTLTDGKIKITAVQDVFSLPQASWAVKVPNTWVPPDTSACLDVHKVFEVPYFMLAGNLRRADFAFLDENDGYLGTVCGQGKSLNAGYRIAVRSGASTPDDQPDSDDFFCGYTPPP